MTRAVFLGTFVGNFCLDFTTENPNKLKLRYFFQYPNNGKHLVLFETRKIKLWTNFQTNLSKNLTQQKLNIIKRRDIITFNSIQKFDIVHKERKESS